MLKCWGNFPGYREFVRDKWTSFQVEGWGGFILKEKLKVIKLALREWHQSHSQNLPAKILVLKDKISTLDLKGETSILVDEEIFMVLRRSCFLYPALIRVYVGNSRG
jgi:hypothetical protein